MCVCNWLRDTSMSERSLKPSFLKVVHCFCLLFSFHAYPHTQSPLKVGGGKPSTWLDRSTLLQLRGAAALAHHPEVIEYMCTCVCVLVCELVYAALWLFGWSSCGRRLLR